MLCNAQFGQLCSLLGVTGAGFPKLKFENSEWSSRKSKLLIAKKSKENLNTKLIDHTYIASSKKQWVHMANENLLMKILHS